MSGEVHVVPEGAVRGGHAADGSPLYVVTVEVNQNSIGNYDPRKTCAEHFYNAEAQCSNTWNVLTVQYGRFTIVTP